MTIKTRATQDGRVFEVLDTETDDRVQIYEISEGKFGVAWASLGTVSTDRAEAQVELLKRAIKIAEKQSK